MCGVTQMELPWSLTFGLSLNGFVLCCTTSLYKFSYWFQLTCWEGDWFLVPLLIAKKECKSSMSMDVVSWHNEPFVGFFYYISHTTQTCKCHWKCRIFNCQLYYGMKLMLIGNYYKGDFRWCWLHLFRHHYLKTQNRGLSSIQKC